MKYTIRYISAALVSLGLSCQVDAALLIHLQFNDTNTATTTAISAEGGFVFDLQNSSGVATALQTGTGITGNPGDYAFDGTAATGMGNAGIGPRALYNSAGANPDLATGNLASFTLSGWYRTDDVGPRLRNLARLVDSSTMTLQGGGSANTELSIVFTSTAGTKSAASTSFSTAYSPIDTWVYFAVTHDSGITGSPNTFFYVGSTTSSVSLVSSTEISSPAAWTGWTTSSDGPVLANAKASGGTNRPFDGLLDNLRIYGENTGGGGARSQAQLEADRLLDLSIPEPSIAVLGLAAAGILCAHHLRK